MGFRHKLHKKTLDSKAIKTDQKIIIRIGLEGSKADRISGGHKADNKTPPFLSAFLPFWSALKPLVLYN